MGSSRVSYPSCFAMLGSFLQFSLRIPTLHTFLCVAGISNSPTAGSFVRPSRPKDTALGFLEALRKKYASGNETSDQAGSEDEIRISGKTVKEVGFEKIRRQLANLQELQVVILDGLCIARLQSNTPIVDTATKEPVSTESLPYGIDACNLTISELDLSRNLLETWEDVVAICAPLIYLRSLKIK